ncbi:MAG: AtpZ/AtpI family protein [Acidimicrobiia bacterium]
MNRAAKGGRVSDDALSQAFEFAAGPVVFGLIGWLIDRTVDTGHLFLVIFAVFGLLGTCATFLYRYQAESARQDEGKPWTRRIH